MAGRIVSATHWQTQDGALLPYVPDHQGVPRVLGVLPPRPNFGAFPRWKDVKPMVPRGQWEERDYSSFNADILDQGEHGSCFPPGTMIRLADGQECPIERIRLLDSVVTAEGNLGQVTQLMVRHDRNELVNIYLFGHRHLAATPEHPILTERGYVPAAELTPGDMVAMPKYLPGVAHSIQVAGHVSMSRWARTDTREMRYRGVAGRDGLAVIVRRLPDLIRLTPGFGRIVGYFLAEGGADTGKIVWTFHQNEAETHAAELRRLLQSELGLESNQSIHETRHACKVTIYGPGWARLFESLCGTGSASKRIHSDLLIGPRDFLASIVSAWEAGDGHRRRGGIMATTVSRSLAMAMFDILSGLGYAPSIRRSEPSISHGVKHREIRWDVHRTEEFRPNYRCRQDDKHTWRRVSGIERVEYEGPVFNMEVAGDNSYVAEGIGVHNCVGHGSVTAFTRAWLMAGHDFIRFSACYIYGKINGGMDEGAIVSDAMDLLIKTGVCLEATVPEGMVYSRQFPRGADAEAAKYRVADAYHVGTFDELISALMYGYVVAHGIFVGEDYSDLDAGGVPPIGGDGGHCQESHGIVQVKAGKHKGEWAARTQNSWTDSWGIGGCCNLVEGHFTYKQNFAGGLDAFAIRAVIDAPDDPTNPPVAA